MMLKVLWVFVFIKCVLGEETLLEPCPHTDIECLKVSTVTFLNRTCAGIPKYGIQPLDPMKLKHVEYADPDSDIVMHFNNIKVTGLKYMKLTILQLDTASKSVLLQTSIDANIVSNLTIEMKTAAMCLAGAYTAKAKASALGTARYTYDLKPNAEGVEYFTVGPETITCEAIGVPEVTLAPKDPDTVARNADYQKWAEKIRRKAVCKILAEGYVVAISNIRASAKIMPKTQFFTDM